jgi:crotonobetainyl-CoA:carnitine CoA-transferase CaiB-like acyl-CoA transferase
MKPLAGVKIVAVEQYGAGPFGTMYLADLGAEVIKIENPPEGDVSRATGPYFMGEGDSQFFQTFNRNKKSLSLNLKTPEAKEIFHKLVAEADGVLNNLRGDQPAKLGLTYEALKTVNPKIVCAHLSAYGRIGPRATYPGYDYLMQAEAGFMHLTGAEDDPPTRFGLSLVDFQTGIVTALGLLAGILGARSSGQGCDIDASLFDVALHQTSYPATWYLNEKDDVGRKSRSAHPSTVPCEVYPTADGWVFVMAMIPKFWESLCMILGLAELVKDERFRDAAARRKNRVVLETVLDPVFKTKTTAEWVAALQGKCPVAPVLTLAQALENPYIREVGMVEAYEHPATGKFEMLSSPYRVNGERPKGTRGPLQGEHTEEILRGLGYDDAAIGELRKKGAV